MDIFRNYTEGAIERFLDPLEAEKFKKQKCLQFCRTPCSLLTYMLACLLTFSFPACIGDQTVLYWQSIITAPNHTLAIRLISTYYTFNFKSKIYLTWYGGFPLPSATVPLLATPLRLIDSASQWYGVSTWRKKNSRLWKRKFLFFCIICSITYLDFTNSDNFGFQRNGYVAIWSLQTP